MSRGCRTKTVCAQSNSPTSPRWRRSGPASTRSWQDRATAEGLKPWYGYFCKRPCFHDEYLQTFNRDNVTLVDTRGLGVERITTGGVVVDGAEHLIDCLIFATGFEVGTDYSRRTGFDLVGRDGLTLTEKWRDGVRTLHGVSVHGFPNCFVLSIAQSGFTVNFPYLLDVQATHTAGLIAWALGHGLETTRGLRRRRDGLGRHHCRAVRRERGEGQGVHAGLLQPRRPGEREHPPGQLLLRQPDRIRRYPRSRRGPTDHQRVSRSRDEATSLSARAAVGGHASAPVTAGGDHRGGIRRSGRRSGVAAQRHRRPDDHRPGRRRRRNVAAQRLSGCGVRHPEPPVLVLVRAESGLDPYVPLSTRDSRLPRAGRRRVRPAQAPAAGHWSAQRALGIRCVALADGIVRRRHRPRRRRGERRRAVRLGAVSRHRRPGRLHRHADAHRTMGYDGRSGRQEGGRHRNRRQRRAGRTRTRRRRRRH